MDAYDQVIKIKFSDTDNYQIIRALQLVEWAINQSEFRNYILNFRNQYGTKAFLQTKQTNQEILKRLIESSENSTTKDYELDIIKYYSASSTIGYTLGDDNNIYLNVNYLERDLPKICNTLVHEYCHLIGMEHSVYNPGWIIWEQTAPYAIGQYVQYMIEKKLGLESKPPFFPLVSWKRRVKHKIKRLFKPRIG